MLSAICFNLDQAKTLSSGNGLKIKWKNILNFFCKYKLTDGLDLETREKKGLTIRYTHVKYQSLISCCSKVMANIEAFHRQTHKTDRTN